MRDYWVVFQAGDLSKEFALQLFSDVWKKQVRYLKKYLIWDFSVGLFIFYFLSKNVWCTTKRKLKTIYHFLRDVVFLYSNYEDVLDELSTKNLTSDNKRVINNCYLKKCACWSSDHLSIFRIIKKVLHVLLQPSRPNIVSHHTYPHAKN